MAYCRTCQSAVKYCLTFNYSLFLGSARHSGRFFCFVFFLINFVCIDVVVCTCNLVHDVEAKWQFSGYHS